jgi:hypothetical protein
MPGARMFMIVTMMLIAPMIDEAPARWIAKIASGSASPVCNTSGGYSVQPDAGPPPGMKSDRISSENAATSSQKLKLFIRGSAMSGAPICSGIIQLPSPTVAGITAPNTMISAWTVVIVLKKPGSTSCIPGSKSSARMTSAIDPPIRNMTRLNTRYIVPMSLWFVVVSQRRIPFAGP